MPKPTTVITTGRENPGVRNASWNRKREGVQDIGAMAGVGDHWVEPDKTRDDVGEARVVEKVETVTAAIHAPQPTIFENVETGHTVVINATVGSCHSCYRPPQQVAVIVEVGSIRICDDCAMKAVDLIQAELPRRRLRLAMERLLAGEVTETLVVEIERLSGG